MRLVLVNWAFENHGSAQDLYSYAQVARALGHEVVLYGPPGASSPFTYSLDINRADAVIFIFEFTTYLQYGDGFDLVRLVGKVPRRRRVVIDCDGKYNDAIAVVGDVNHPNDAASRRWVEVCDSLSDTICQPTLHPLRPNVRPFLFHAYDPAWERPLDCRGKDFGMVYVGNNWFRWRALERVLRAIEPVRDRVGRIGLVGHGWGSPAPWGGPTFSADAYRMDPAYLRKMDVEVMAPVGFERVVAWMSKGIFSPVVYRPLFSHLRLVTCRTFETPAANTIPLFAQDAESVTELYGREAVELVMPREQPEEKISDLMQRPGHYMGIVADIRRHLVERHSYAARLRELIQVVES